MNIGVKAPVLQENLFFLPKNFYPLKGLVFLIQAPFCQWHPSLADICDCLKKYPVSHPSKRSSTIPLVQISPKTLEEWNNAINIMFTGLRQAKWSFDLGT